jgi:hypothetical protein
LRPEDLIEKLGEEEKDLLSNREIFSPYFPGAFQIITRIQGIIYRFKIKKREDVGFGIFRPKNRDFAYMKRKANEDEIAEFLEIVPKVKGILVFKTDTWYCLPQNINAYAKLGFHDLTPVYNVENAEAFDYFVGRFVGGNVWFEDLDPNCDFEKVEAIKAAKKTLPRVSGLTPEDHMAFELALKNVEEQEALTLGGRLAMAFEKKGARLESFKELSGNRVEVKWISKKNQPYTSVVDKRNLNVVCAGICLAGQDTRFDLDSLIGVVAEGERRRHIVHGDYRAHYGADVDEEYDYDDY